MIARARFTRGFVLRRDSRVRAWMDANRWIKASGRSDVVGGVCVVTTVVGSKGSVAFGIRCSGVRARHAAQRRERLRRPQQRQYQPARGVAVVVSPVHRHSPWQGKHLVQCCHGRRGRLFLLPFSMWPLHTVRCQWRAPAVLLRSGVAVRCSLVIGSDVVSRLDLTMDAVGTRDSVSA